MLKGTPMRQFDNLFCFRFLINFYILYVLIHHFIIIDEYAFIILLLNENNFENYVFKIFIKNDSDEIIKLRFIKVKFNIQSFIFNINILKKYSQMQIWWENELFICSLSYLRDKDSLFTMVYDYFKRFLFISSAICCVHLSPISPVHLVDSSYSSTLPLNCTLMEKSMSF